MKKPTIVDEIIDTNTEAMIKRHVLFATTFACLADIIFIEAIIMPTVAIFENEIT